MLLDRSLHHGVRANPVRLVHNNGHHGPDGGSGVGDVEFQNQNSSDGDSLMQPRLIRRNLFFFLCKIFNGCAASLWASLPF